MFSQLGSVEFCYRQRRVATLIICGALSCLMWCSQATVAAQEMPIDELTGDEQHLLHEVSSMAGSSPDPLDKPIPQPSSRQTGSSGGSSGSSGGDSLLASIDERTKQSIAKMVGGLALVVAIFLAVTMLLSQRKPKASSGLSIVQVISRTPLTKSQQLQLVRVGNRLLLIAISEQHVDTLTEFSDPQEISEIEQMVKQGDLSVWDRARQRLAPSGSRAASPTPRRQPVYEA